MECHVGKQQEGLPEEVALWLGLEGEWKLALPAGGHPRKHMAPHAGSQLGTASQKAVDLNKLTGETRS